MADDSVAVVGLLRLVGRLKRLPRQGWVLLGVPNPESVADHSFRLALMTLLTAHGAAGVNVERALTLALCHDLPEALAGDAKPFDESLQSGTADPARLFRERPVYSVDADRAKQRAEEDALWEMTAGLPAALRRLIVAAWEEYEAGITPEARLVRQLDKLEALLQAHEHRAEIPALQVESFRLGALDHVHDEQVVRLMQAIQQVATSNV